MILNPSLSICSLLQVLLLTFFDETLGARILLFGSWSCPPSAPWLEEPGVAAESLMLSLTAAASADESPSDSILTSTLNPYFLSESLEDPSVKPLFICASVRTQQ